MQEQKKNLKIAVKINKSTIKERIRTSRCPKESFMETKQSNSSFLLQLVFKQSTTKTDL